jgi:hypothetical protein
MPSAHEIALDVLRSFGPNVVSRRHPLTYGQYAAAIGRDPTEYGLAIGKAMHAIGALCVIQQIPVAPLHWVRPADGKPLKIFESDPKERSYIVESGDIEIMRVVAREYHYRESEFKRLETALKNSLERGHLTKMPPNELWHLTFIEKPKGLNVTYYERAMIQYREINEQLRMQRATAKLNKLD